MMKYEPRCEKTSLQGFRPGPSQTGLCNCRKCLEAWTFGFRKLRNCTIRVAKTKALISFAVTAKLICVFVFTYTKIRFSHDAANIEFWWDLTLSLLVSSAENLGNILDPDQARKSFWHSYGIPEIFFLKKLILRKMSADDRNMSSYPACKELSIVGKFSKAYTCPLGLLYIKKWENMSYEV